MIVSRYSGGPPAAKPGELGPPGRIAVGPALASGRHSLPHGGRCRRSSRTTPATCCASSAAARTGHSPARDQRFRDHTGDAGTVQDAPRTCCRLKLRVREAH